MASFYEKKSFFKHFCAFPKSCSLAVEPSVIMKQPKGKNTLLSLFNDIPTWFITSCWPSVWVNLQHVQSQSSCITYVSGSGYAVGMPIAVKWWTTLIIRTKWKMQQSVLSIHPSGVHHKYRYNWRSRGYNNF